jgi:hypothetical protein
MIELNCPHVSTCEGGGEIHQILFEENHEDEDGPYVLISRAFLEEEDESEEASVYVETHDARLIGHYPRIGTEINRDNLTLTLPEPASETIKIHFSISDRDFHKMVDTLVILRMIGPDENFGNGQKASECLREPADE